MIIRQFQSLSSQISKYCRYLCYSTNSNINFASATSQKETLSEAVLDCLHEVTNQLQSDHFSFGQLFVSSAYGEYVPLASSYLMETHENKKQNFTVLIGGSVQEIILPGNSQPVQGVSLLAGQLPEAQIYPFQIDKATLPYLQGDADWTELFSLDEKMGRKEDGEKLLGLLLTEPYFVDVEQFLRRMTNVLPSTPIIGGIVQPTILRKDASPQGVLYMNERATTGGGVGCLVRGKMKMHAVTSTGGQAVGPVMRVTHSQDNMLLELDGKPALDQMMLVLNHFKGQNIAINIAVDESGKGEGFVLRDLLRPDFTQKGVIIAVDEIAEGSKVQVYVRNEQQGRECLKQQVLSTMDKMDQGQETHSSNKCDSCMMMYSCVGVRHEEGDVLQEIPSTIAFQGAKFQGEIGPLSPGGGGGVVHSYTSTIAAIGKENQ